jgi:hypothetical protein
VIEVGLDVLVLERQLLGEIGVELEPVRNPASTGDDRETARSACGARACGSAA